jgi:uncharacterized protein (TIGR02646 family)
MSWESTKRKKALIREKIFAKFDGHCAYCGCKIEIETFEIDHKTPKSKGGKNNLINLFPSCGLCNTFKYNRDIREFKKYLISIPSTIKNRPIFNLMLELNILQINKIKNMFYFERVK